MWLLKLGGLLMLDERDVVVREIGPPTSIGESAELDGAGLAAEFLDILCGFRMWFNEYNCDNR